MHDLELNNCVVSRLKRNVFYLKALSQISSGSSNPKSSSHWIFNDVKGSKLYVFSKEYTFPIFLLEPELSFRVEFRSVLGGWDGKWVNDVDMKLRSCKNLKRWEFGRLNLSFSWSKDAKILSINRFSIVATPLLAHSWKAPSMIDGMNWWFFVIGAQVGRSLREKLGLNCVRILKECFTIGFEVNLDMESKRGSFEHRSECKEVWRQEEFSIRNHSGVVSPDGESFQNNIDLMLAAQ